VETYLSDRGDLRVLSFKESFPCGDFYQGQNKPGRPQTQRAGAIFCKFLQRLHARGQHCNRKKRRFFERPFERIPVTDENYLMRLIVYVHQNPQKHGFVKDFRDWNYSSYHELIGDVHTRLQRHRVMELFGSRQDFIRIHQEIQPLVDFDEEEGTGLKT
jgi:hypothetical protein